MGSAQAIPAADVCSSRYYYSPFTVIGGDLEPSIPAWSPTLAQVWFSNTLRLGFPEGRAVFPLRRGLHVVIDHLLPSSLEAGGGVRALTPTAPLLLTFNSWGKASTAQEIGLFPLPNRADEVSPCHFLPL